MTDDIRALETDDAGVSTVERADTLDMSPLSPREREVLDPAMEGLSAREIATRLSLTEATVRSHLSTIYSKLGVAGRVELLARVTRVAGSAPAGPAAIAASVGRTAETDASTTGRAIQPSRRRRRTLAIAGIVLVVVSAAALVLLTRSDPGKRTDVATVSDLISSGQVATMVVHGQTVTVTERDGTRLIVDPVPAFGIDPVVQTAISAGVDVRTEKPASSPSLEAIFATGVVVSVALLVAILMVVVWIVRRRPAVRSAG